MKQIKTYIPLLVLIFMCQLSFSQEEPNSELGPLVTDRPDATESPAVVPLGYLQMETGAFFESFDDNGLKVNSTVYNTSLLRIGILEHIEFRLGWDLNRIKTTINGIE